MNGKLIKFTSNARRWNETCAKCGEKCKGKGTNWIDGTRICQPCRKILAQDVFELQSLALKAYEHVLPTEDIIRMMQAKKYEILVKR